MIDRYGKASLPNRYKKAQLTWALKTKQERQEHMKPANDAWQDWYASLSDEEVRHIVSNRVSKTTKSFGTSNLEGVVGAALQSLGIPYTWQFTLEKRQYDFRIDQSNLIIEVNGDYWHANPSLYEESSVIKYPGSKVVTARDIWDRDTIKREIAYKHGFDVLYLWESNIKKYKVDLHTFVIQKIAPASILCPL